MAGQMVIEIPIHFSELLACQEVAWMISDVPINPTSNQIDVVTRLVPDRSAYDDRPNARDPSFALYETSLIAFV